MLSQGPHREILFFYDGQKTSSVASEEADRAAFVRYFEAHSLPFVMLSAGSDLAQSVNALGKTFTQIIVATRSLPRKDLKRLRQIQPGAQIIWRSYRAPGRWACSAALRLAHIVLPVTDWEAHYRWRIQLKQGPKMSSIVAAPSSGLLEFYQSLPPEQQPLEVLPLTAKGGPFESAGSTIQRLEKRLELALNGVFSATL